MRTTKRTIALMALLGAAGLAAGCNTSEARPAAGTSKVEGSLLYTVSKDVRAKLVKDMQDDLAAINALVQEVSDKVENARIEAKAEANAKLVALRDKAVALNVELEKARSAEAAAWEQLRLGFTRSSSELKESVAQARTWLSDKIAP